MPDLDTLADGRPLLAAKMRVPSPPSTAVERRRLHDLIGPVPRTRLTTVVAPGGWGKSTLLAAWSRDPAVQGRVGWLSLDPSDDEPMRFWTYALAALGAVGPDLTRDSLAALRAPGSDTVDLALSLLLNAFSTVDRAHVLVLDDFQTITNPLVHQGVEFLLTYAPTALRLVIASRQDPPLPLARMRARGELTEIRAKDLGCTPEEAAALVSAVDGRAELSTDTQDQLVRRTEGWPAGLHLAALAMRGSDEPEAVAAGLRGDDRHLVDYFGAEVIPGLAVAERRLLVGTSPLERLSGSLCDAVLEVRGSHDVLEGLDRASLFVTALGEGWYRCHHLFRDVLGRELAREGEEAVSSVHARAAAWFRARGRLEEALEHYLAAGDDEAALDVIVSEGRWFMDHGAYAALLTHGAVLAGRVDDARLCLTLAGMAGIGGDLEGCAAWLQAAEPLIAAADEDAVLPGWKTLRGAADATSAIHVVHGDTDKAMAHARRAAELEDDPGGYGFIIARQALAGALLGSGQVDDAVAVLEECWRSPMRRQLSATFFLQLAGQLALALVEKGDLDALRRLSDEVEDRAAAAERAWGHGAAAAVAGLRLAQARALMVTDPPRARAALERAVGFAEGWGRTTVLVAALTSLAAAQWGDGAQADARVALARAVEAAEMGEARPTTLEQLRALEDRIGRGASQAAVHTGELFEQLTDRELSILRALRGSLSAREIGAELYLSINTVKGYTKSLYRKLGVVSRADAVRRGRELGLI